MSALVSAAPVVVDQSKSLPEVGGTWNSQVQKKLYDGDPVGVFSNLRSTLVDQTPLSAITIAMEKITSDFSKQAPNIASECKKLNPENVWAQISCASNSVNATFLKYKWPDTSTACRAHAEAFRTVFLELKIPRSDAGSIDAITSEGLHVVNRFTVTDKNGKAFSYVMDAGWAPEQIFPLSESAQEFHQNNKILPEVSFKAPKYSFAPVKKICADNAFKANLSDIWKCLNPE